MKKFSPEQCAQIISTTQSKPIKMNQWIKCSESLPENDEYVLCFSDEHGTFVAQRWGSIWHDNAPCHSDCFDGYSLGLIEVSHWQPLPNPPGE